MIPTSIIFFREILEIALILGVIAAATRGVAGRTRWIMGGITLGLAGAGVVAMFASELANLADGMGQEVFNASILALAAAMIGWTVVWMKKHARALSQKIKQMGHSVQKGDMPLYALALVISVAIWREGSEIVLFMAGIMATSPDSMASMAMGGLGGSLAALTVGGLLYAGLISIPVRYFFAATEWMLILLAAGLAMQSVGYLIAADMLPSLIPVVWDSSALLANDHFLGELLHILVGYNARPSGMQLIAYASTIAGILMTMRVVNAPKSNAGRTNYSGAQPTA